VDAGTTTRLLGDAGLSAELLFFAGLRGDHAGAVRHHLAAGAPLKALAVRPSPPYRRCLQTNPQCDPVSQHQLHHVDESTPTAPHCL
jgi:hypothetical protein